MCWSCLGISIYGIALEVNFKSRSECRFALTPGQDIGYVHYTTYVGTTEEGEDLHNVRILQIQVHKQMLMQLMAGNSETKSKKVCPL